MERLLVVLCVTVTLFLQSSTAIRNNCCSCNKFSTEQQKQLQSLLQLEAGSLRQGMQMMCPKKPNRWHRVNTTNPQGTVCFSAKGDQHGTFTIDMEGFVAAIKLVYRSGWVTCEKDGCHSGSFKSRWGCSTNHPYVGSTPLGTFITTHSNRVLFPREKFIRDKSMSTWYALPGFDSDSDFLVFHDFANPEFFQRNQMLHLWYGEDLKNVGEENNDGVTCADVFVWYL